MKSFNLLLIFLLLSQLTFAQERYISGTVKDQNGELLPGAYVVVETTNRSTQTDVDGKYSIKAKADEFLVFSYMGMENQRVSALKPQINVTLKGAIDPFKDCEYFETGGYFPRHKNRIPPSAEEIRLKTDPKYYFRQCRKNKRFTIFIHTNYFCKCDEAFAEKFHASYSPPYNYTEDYAKTYNNLVFRYLNRKYKKTWQQDIRLESIGLTDFLKWNGTATP